MTFHYSAWINIGILITAYHNPYKHHHLKQIQVSIREVVQAKRLKAEPRRSLTEWVSRLLDSDRPVYQEKKMLLLPIEYLHEWLIFMVCM